jgi:hypothetical protein
MNLNCFEDFDPAQVELTAQIHVGPNCPGLI